jgi:predicted transcriptional regulator of viral defense system
MSRKRQLDFAAFVSQHPVFTLEELAEARGGSADRGAARNQLKHYLGEGRVESVARGIYAAVPPGLAAQGFEPDRYLVAAAAKPDGIFAYHAALELLGAAHSVWSECSLHTRSPRSPIELGSTRLVFLPTPEPLKRGGLEELGIVLVPHEVRQLRVTGPERTLVEGFRQPHRVGGLAELVESAEGFALLDFPLLEKVFAAYDQRALWAAIGWFVESRGQQWSPPDEFLARCRANRPRRNQYLLRDVRGGRAVAGWNLIFPTELVRGFEGHAADA